MVRPAKASLSGGHKQQTRARGTFSLSNLFCFQIFSGISDCGTEVEGTENEKKRGHNGAKRVIRPA